MPRKSKPQPYSSSQLKALERVRIPDKLKCDRCNKYKGHHGYSAKQLNDARYAFQNQGQSAKYKIKCQPCTGGQPVEIECTVCSVTKGLEAFAKVQRRKLDTAECYQCTEKRLDVAPYDEQKYLGENRRRAFSSHDESEFQPTIFDISASDTSSDWDESELEDNAAGGVSLSEGFERSLSITDDSNHVETLIGAEFNRGNQPSQNGGWQMVECQSQRSWHTPSGHSRTITNSTTTSHGFNRNAYGRPSAPSVQESHQSFSSSIAERSEVITMSANGKFAKIPAYVPPKEEWSSDEEDSDQSSASDNNDSDDDDDDDDDVDL